MSQNKSLLIKLLRLSNVCFKEMDERPRTPPKPVQPVASVEAEQEIAFLKTELFHAGQEIAVCTYLNLL